MSEPAPPRSHHRGPVARCARCGQVEVAGHREDMPMCPSCEGAATVEALAPGARYREIAAALRDGPDLPPGPLAQPSPYSDQRTALLVVIAHRDARIRELEAENARLRAKGNP